MLDFEVLAHHGEEVTVAVRGQLVHSERLAAMREFLDDHYVDDGVRRIRLDLSAVDQLDLEGIATLIALAREANVKAKALTTEEVGGQPAMKLRQTGTEAYLSGRGQP